LILFIFNVDPNGHFIRGREGKWGGGLWDGNYTSTIFSKFSFSLQVNFLENENQILRQFAPIDFISTLPSFPTSSASSRRESTIPSFL